MDYKARFYSPVLNRFIQPDSIVPNPMNPQAFNKYSYVLNSPINFNDPTGHAYCDFINSQNKEDCGGGLARSQKSSVIWKKKDKEKDINECETVKCKAYSGDVGSILELIRPSHWGWRFNFSLAFGDEAGVGAGVEISASLIYYRQSRELILSIDGGGNAGLGIKVPVPVDAALTSGPVFGWGQSSSGAGDASLGGSANFSAKGAGIISISAPVNLLPKAGLYTDPYYGVTPAEIYIGGGVGCCGAGVSASGTRNIETYDWSGVFR